MTARSTSRLPATLTHFFGREQESADLEATVADARLVTLTGPPGCGKTRLAIEVGSRLTDRFDDGVGLVDLAAVSDPARVAGAVAVAIGVDERPGHRIEDTLVDALTDRESLLIVDNCEHLATAVATMVRRVVDECPAVSVVATSRVALGVAGERVWQVAPLDPQAALDLFVDRALLVRPAADFLDANRDALAEICGRLDGLPLAIELAAAWTRVLAPGQLLERFDSALPLLPAGGQVTSDRRETMAATVEWSYRLLDPEDQQLFGRLSVFAGSFDLAAAQAVGRPDGDILVGLTSLVDHSLLVTESGDDEMRYRLLEPIRQSAESRLIERGEAATARRRHAEHYLDVATRSDRDLLAGRRGEALRTLERDEPNLVAALEWARAERADLGLRLAAALGLFWELHGRVNEGRTWLDDMLTIETADPRVRSNALYRTANLAWQQRDDAAAGSMLRESLDIERRLGDDLGVARRLRGLALVAMTEGDIAAATELCEEAIDVLRAHGDVYEYDVVWTLFHLGLTRLAVGDLTGATELMCEALTVNANVGSLVATAHCELYLSRAAVNAGDVAAARSHLEASLKAMQEMGGVIAGADWMWAGAALALAEGRQRAALRLAGAAEALSSRSGNHVPAQLIADLAPPLNQARKEVGAVLADRLATEGTQLSLEELATEATAEADDLDDDPLTRREREVAELVAEGLSNPEIGRRLFISRRTVETHVEHIKQKLGLGSRAQLIAQVLGAAAGPPSRHPEPG